jgi:signal transduction histidine kinase
MLGFCFSSMKHHEVWHLWHFCRSLISRLAESRAMLLPDFLRTTRFRLAASFAVMFALSMILLFAFIYWQTGSRETARIDRFLVADAASIAGRPVIDIERAVSSRSLGDLHRITFAALFAPDGRALVGNLASFPPGLQVDGRAHAVRGLPLEPDALDLGAARVVARRLGNGDILVVGRNIDALQTLGEIVLGGLELGVIPALLLSIAAGAFVSWRAQQRVKSVHRSAERILDGALRERLPVRGTDDDFDRLARGVNLMLDEIGRLLDSVKGAGNEIARDLRAPLARLRDRLARAKETAPDAAALRDLVDEAVTELDRTLAMTTTLLRIGEIEGGRRHAGAEHFDLAALVEEVGQIYQPLAEDAGIGFEIAGVPGLIVTADRGLLLEAIANLAQNAIKFTPAGGTVRVAAVATPEGPAVRVADTGPGIPASARGRIFERFFRLDPSKQEDGVGLGLSLVAAIAKFHGYRVTVEEGAPGSVFTLWCRPAPVLAPV